MKKKKTNERRYEITIVTEENVFIKVKMWMERWTMYQVTNYTIQLILKI